MWNINIYNVYIYRTADSYPWSILNLNVSQVMAGLQSYHIVSCPILLSFVHDYQLRQELFMLWLTIRGPPGKFSIFTEPKVTVSQQLLWIQLQYQCNHDNNDNHATGWSKSWSSSYRMILIMLYWLSSYKMIMI